VTVLLLPDLHVKVEELSAERDLVVARFSVTATHKGAIFGARPTGKKVTFYAMDMVRFQGGKATEVWHYGNEMEVFAQLGVRPPA
jgi:predicted ester cyclase